MLRRPPFLQCTLALFTGAALVISMSACDSLGSFTRSEEDPDVEIGHFEMVLSGAVQDTLDGRAIFGTKTEEDPETGEETELFGLIFMPDTTETTEQRGSWFASEIMRASDRPGEGAYEFAQIEANHLPDAPSDFPDDAYLFGFQTENTVRTAAMTSDAGTLTITTSSSSRVAGTFSVEASGMFYEYNSEATDAEPPDSSITVEGKFNALGGELPSQN